jgi:hypothetical protein
VRQLAQAAGEGGGEQERASGADAHPRIISRIRRAG